MAVSLYEMERQNRLMQAAGQPVMTSGVPEDPMVRAQRMIAAARQSAPQGIDPRMAALLDRQLQRVSEQEQQIGRDGRRTPWEALMRAGAAMASSRSPFFAPALAAGTAALGDTIQERRMATLRARAAAEAQRDQIEMERLKAEGAGLRAAEEGVDRTIGLAGKLSDMDARAAQAQADLARAREIEDPALRRLAVVKAEAEVRKINREADESVARAGKLRRETQEVGRGGGSDVESRGDRAELDKAVADFAAADAVYQSALKQAGGNPANIEDQSVVQERNAKRARALQFSKTFNRRYGQTPYPFGGAAMGQVPAQPPAANNDPLGLRR
jgi:hypothetical protein